MAEAQHIRLFSTDQHRCSYLPDQLATLQFVDPELALSDALVIGLNDNGFRRSGAHYYRPRCSGCNACTALRVPVADFRPSRSQQRCLRSNIDLVSRWSHAAAADHDRYYPLYANYISSRHAEGDMYPPTREQYDSFIGAGLPSTGYLEFYLGSDLLMVAQTDQFGHGLSSVYTFYNPVETKRGLGTYAILKQIDLANKLGLPFLFLGYWVEHSPKMAYKQKFQRHERFLDGRWQRL